MTPGQRTPLPITPSAHDPVVRLCTGQPQCHTHGRKGAATTVTDRTYVAILALGPARTTAMQTRGLPAYINGRNCAVHLKHQWRCVLPQMYVKLLLNVRVASVALVPWTLQARHQATGLSEFCTGTWLHSVPVLFGQKFGPLIISAPSCLEILTVVHVSRISGQILEKPWKSWENPLENPDSVRILPKIILTGSQNGRQSHDNPEDRDTAVVPIGAVPRRDRKSWGTVVAQI